MNLLFTLPTFPNIVFVAVITTLTAYTTFLMSKGHLTDHRYSFWKRLTKRGKEAVALSIVVGILILYQELSNSTRSERKDLLLKKETNKRDSLIENGIKKGVDSSSKKLFADISEAFKKQGLELDALKKEVNWIRDSAKRVTNNINNSQPDPILVVDSTGISQNSKDSEKFELYNINVKSLQAGSTNFDLTTYVLYQYPNGRDLLTKQNFLDHDSKLGNGGGVTAVISVRYHPEIIQVYITGTYTTLDGKKKYTEDGLYTYIVDENKTRILVPEFKKKVVKHILSMPLNKTVNSIKFF